MYVERTRFQALVGSAVGWVMAAGLLLTVGCGDETDDEDTGWTPLPDIVDPADDAADTDVRDAEVNPVDPDTADAEDGGEVDTGGCDMPGNDCMEGQVCEEGTCVDLGKLKCDATTSKGTLVDGGSLSFSDTFEGSDQETDGLSTECAATDDVPEHVHKFEVSEDLLIDVSTQFDRRLDAKVEFRRGGCLEENSERRTCLDTDDDVWIEGGTTVYMVVENDTGGTGNYTIDLNGESAACNPGRYRCSNQTTLQYCRVCSGGSEPPCNGTSGPTRVEFECPTQCKSNICEGATCRDPIEVNGSGVYSGNLGGYDAELNFSNISDGSRCTIGNNDDVKPATAGAEVRFKVDLNKGDEMTVDTQGDDRDNVLFITKNCRSRAKDIECIAATDDEVIQRWKAPSSGTYYVIVDKFSLRQGRFNVQFKFP